MDNYFRPICLFSAGFLLCEAVVLAVFWYCINKDPFIGCMVLGMVVLAGFVVIFAIDSMARIALKHVELQIEELRISREKKEKEQEIKDAEQAFEKERNQGLVSKGDVAVLFKIKSNS